MSFPNAVNLTPEIWKAGLRTAAAAGIAYWVAEALSLPQGYWSVITAIVIMQANLGASLEAAADRLLGTLAGAVLGFAVAYLTPSTNTGTFWALMLATALLAMLAARYPSFRIAPVTAAILLISAPSHADTLISALHRVAEISLGCVIGIAVSLLIAPSRAETRLRNEASHALSLMANLITMELEGPGGPEGKADDEAITATSEDIYGSFSKIEKLTKETHEEHATRLARRSFDTNRFLRCLHRLRTTAFFLRRVTGLSWPTAIGDTLAGPTKAVTQATYDYLTALGPAVAAGALPPSLDEFQSSFDQFATAAESAARLAHDATRTQDSGFNEARHAEGEHAVAFVSAFSFALEQVRFSIEELVECVKEMSDTADRS